MLGRSRKCSSADRAAAADSGRPPASPMASAIRSAIISDSAPSRFAAWSRATGPPWSAKLVVKRERPGRLAGRHAGTGATQPGQRPGTRAGNHPPGAARRAVGEAAVGHHHARARPARDLAGQLLQAGVLGGPVVAVVHERGPRGVPLDVAAEPVGDVGLGELGLAVELLVSVLLPGRDGERALRACCHAGSPPLAGDSPRSQIMCESHTSLAMAAQTTAGRHAPRTGGSSDFVPWAPA